MIINGWNTSLIAVFLLLTQPVLADCQAGFDAYNNGGYITALNEWQLVVAKPPGTIPPAAKQGDSAAEAELAGDFR